MSQNAQKHESEHHLILLGQSHQDLQSLSTVTSVDRYLNTAASVWLLITTNTRPPQTFPSKHQTVSSECLLDAIIHKTHRFLDNSPKITPNWEPLVYNIIVSLELKGTKPCDVMKVLIRCGGWSCRGSIEWWSNSSISCNTNREKPSDGRRIKTVLCGDEMSCRSGFRIR